MEMIGCLRYEELSRRSWWGVNSQTHYRSEGISLCQTPAVFCSLTQRSTEMSCDNMASTQTVQQAEYHHSSRRQFKWQNVLFIVAASLGSCMYGYSASVISTTLIQPSFIKVMGLDTAADAKDLTGLTGSVRGLPCPWRICRELSRSGSNKY